MRWPACLIMGLLMVTGCTAKKSSLLLERRSRGPLEEEAIIAKPMVWRLSPVLQTQTKDGVEVTINFAPPTYLNNFFGNKKIFGPYAGANPYYPEHMVFYVKVANHSGKRIGINPNEFVLVDNEGAQYTTIGVDYVTALGESRRPVGTTTRTVLAGASPGYFGVSIPVGKLFIHEPQGPFALLKQSSLQAGYLYPDVVHDGLIAFWSPASDATKLRLVIANVKSDFDPNDFPKSSLDFVFEFDAAASTK